jgi:hypothetical protein
MSSRSRLPSGLATFMFLVIVSCNERSPVSPTMTIDVFPLATGSTFHYSYQYNNTNRDMDPADGSSDSGYVEYHILSFIHPSDSACTWKVQETRHLLHKTFQLWGYPGWQDSMVNWQDSNVVLDLSENLTGLH